VRPGVPGDEGDTMDRCTFCGKARDEVRLLIGGTKVYRGPRLFICDECVALDVDVLLAHGIDIPALGSPGPPSSRSDVKCSFCGKSDRQVQKLISGPGVYICDECVDLCVDILDEEGIERGSRKPGPFGGMGTRAEDSPD